MKRPEQYIEEFYKNKSLNSKVIYDFIKQIQLDTIDETVELCAENARLEESSNYGNFNEKFAKFKLTDQITYSIMSYGHGDCGYEAVRISKESILNCAKKLKQQLE